LRRAVRNLDATSQAVPTKPALSAASCAPWAGEVCEGAEMTGIIIVVAAIVLVVLVVVR
jgi:hypothetical protein